jgi:hypothetical protein
MVSSTVSKSNVHKSVAMISPWNLSEDCNLKHKGVAWSQRLLFPSRHGTLPSACMASFNTTIWQQQKTSYKPQSKIKIFNPTLEQFMACNLLLINRTDTPWFTLLLTFLKTLFKTRIRVLILNDLNSTWIWTKETAIIRSIWSNILNDINCHWIPKVL